MIYMKNLIRINLTGSTVKKEELDNSYLSKGGRTLTSSIIYSEVDPECEPLGENNKLVFAIGLLTGTGISSSARLSAGAKSPLSGGIKESNSGGIVSGLLARAGIRALIFEGLPTAETLKILIIDGDKIYLEDAGYLQNTGVFKTFQALKEKHGDKSGILCIGQAGEKKLPSAAVMVNDPFGHARALARGGIGAVMGAKRIKAVVVKDHKTEKARPADEAALKEQRKKFNQLVLEDPRLENRKQYGTASIVNAVNAMGALPTYSFRHGNFEYANNLSGETLHDTIVERKGNGKVSAPCMRGCLISCSNAYPDTNGEVIVSTLQYETIGMLGSNCGMENLDKVAILNRLCNDYGLDTIETGVALGILMDVGEINYGDLDQCVQVLKEVAEGTPLGRIIGSGALITGKAYGTNRIPVGRSQAIPAYDPRALKGNGVTYITSPMDADHTAGNAFGARNKVDPLGKNEQVNLSLNLQIDAAIVDLLGMCLFARTPVFNDLDLVADLVNSLHGLDIGREDIRKIARETISMEDEFNFKAGVSKRRFPEFFYKEELPPHKSVFDVPQEEIEDMQF